MTIARFRAENEKAIEKVVVDVVGLCARAGLASLGQIAIDPTTIGSDAAWDAHRDAEWIRAQISEILAEAEATDAAEHGRPAVVEDLVEPGGVAPTRYPPGASAGRARRGRNPRTRCAGRAGRPGRRGSRGRSEAARRHTVGPARGGPAGAKPTSRPQRSPRTDTPTATVSPRRSPPPGSASRRRSGPRRRPPRRRSGSP